MTITYRGMVGSWRTLGTGATPQNLFTIENQAASPVIVRITRLVVQMDATAVLVSVMPQVKVSRATGLPSGGTATNKTPFDTAMSSNAKVVARSGTASDGGVATAITATAGDVMWQQYCMRMHTVVGQVLSPDNNALPSLIEGQPVLLRAGESLLVQIVASAGGSNPATNHWFVNAAWEEDTP